MDNNNSNNKKIDKDEKSIERINWFVKNEKILIPLTSVIMMLIAVLSFVFSVVQNNKNSRFQREFTEKQKLSDSLREIKTKQQYQEQFEYQKFRDSLTFGLYKTQAERQFKSDSQTIKIALNQYKESSRPFVSLMKTDFKDENGGTTINISFGNKCNIPVEATNMRISFSGKYHPPIKSSLNSVLAPNESAEKSIGIQFFNLDDMEIITIRIKYHSIFSPSKEYYSERKLFNTNNYGTSFIEQTTGQID